MKSNQCFGSMIWDALAPTETKKDITKIVSTVTGLHASALNLPFPGQEISPSRIHVTCHLSSMVTCLQ